MPFDQKDAAELIRIARAVAKTEVMPHFRALDDDQIKTKTDSHDIVTEADTRAEIALTHGFARSFPDAVVIGEEAVADDSTVLDRLSGQGRVIVVDPIDGTWNYSIGQTTFGMILAVIENGQTVFGFHLDPVMDDWIYAHRGGGAHWAREGMTRPLRTRARTGMDQQIGLATVALFPPDKRAQMVLAGLNFGRVLSPRCSAHEYRMLAEGHVDFCFGALLKVWDHAAGVLIATEAGGHSALLDGSPYSPLKRNGMLLNAANESIWTSVAETYAFLRP